MTLWDRILALLERLAPGETLSGLFDRLRAPPERSVAFTIAVIALGAKMAKADGRVTSDEVAAFREVFVIAPAEEANAARVFDLARTDVAGFEDYAERIARMFEDDAEVLRDLLEGLFHIAVADGDYHPARGRVPRAGRRDLRPARRATSARCAPASRRPRRATATTCWAWSRTRRWTRSAPPGAPPSATAIPTARWRAACRRRRSSSPRSA